jgi:hydrogenase maturation factor HypF (carbamoyltransferase family)
LLADNTPARLWHKAGRSQVIPPDIARCTACLVNLMKADPKKASFMTAGRAPTGLT